MQADADAYVICPSRRVARLAASAGRKVFVSEFAHFMPSPSEPQGCTGFGPEGCQGLGCDAGVEFDVVPGRHTASTKLFASHGADPRFVFGTEHGPDQLANSNVTDCTFNSEEAELSRTMMAHWAAFSRHGDPNVGAAPGTVHWPAAEVDSSKQVTIRRLRFALAATDGVPTGLVDGINDGSCDFWDALYPSEDGAAAAVIFA